MTTGQKQTDDNETVPETWREPGKSPWHIAITRLAL